MSKSQNTASPITTVAINTHTPGGSGSIPSWQIRMQRSPQSLPLEYPWMAPKLTGGPLSLFKNTYQSGFLSILYAIGQRPLENWEKQVYVANIRK